jgi:transcriptional regulator with XRE-family HTH domain
MRRPEKVLDAHNWAIYCHQVMTDAGESRKRLRQVMKIRGVKSSALARAVGIRPGTLRNIACGHSKSRRTRQKISNFLAATIWEGIRPATVLVTIPPGVLLSNLTQSPREFAREFPNSGVKIVNQHSVKVLKPIDVLLRLSTHVTPPQAETRPK